jgi:hypothetical protein
MLAYQVEGKTNVYLKVLSVLFAQLLVKTTIYYDYPQKD